MKKIFSLICCSVLSYSAFSQNGHLPDVTFPSGKNICDPNPWELVFHDYFDGTQLRSPWITYTSCAVRLGALSTDTPKPLTVEKIGDRIILKLHLNRISLGKESAMWLLMALKNHNEYQQQHSPPILVSG